MNSVFVIEGLQQNGKPWKSPRYHYGLSTFEHPKTTASLGKAVAIDGANWTWEAARIDVDYIQSYSKSPMRIREIKLNKLKFEALKWRTE